jgi:hypothetical protein
MSDPEGSTGGSPPANEGGPEDRHCRFNPLANRYEWWAPGQGFTGEPCTPTEGDDGGSGTGDT